jgi:hypothetical protein
MEMTIPEVYEQAETLKMGQHGSGGSFIDVEGRLYEMPAGQAKLDENVENGAGSPTGTPLA